MKTSSYVLVACLFSCNAVEPDAEPLDSEALELSRNPAELTALARALKQGRFGADPTALNANGALHVYSTSRPGLNVPHFQGSTPDDITSLAAATEALPDAERGAQLQGGIWAPTVRKAGDHYAMWYSGEVAGSSTKKCLWRAKATRPEGPFHKVGAGEPICPDDHWNIDPYLFRAPGGFWLYSKVSGQLERRRLEDDGLTFASGSKWEHVLGPSQAWEQGSGQDRPLVENPAIVQLAKADGKQRWIFFYSANAWRTSGYAVGYADCGAETGIGACTKESLSRGWLRTGVAGAPHGPGAASFFNYKGGDYMIIHGWENACTDDCPAKNPKGRSLYLFRVGLGAGGNPIARAL